MTKEEISNTILSLHTDEEIVDFVERRIDELEENSIETTVGQNYTVSFREYISKKTHYKAGDRFERGECPDLVYDDIIPYINIVKVIRKNGWYTELFLFTAIYFELEGYSPIDSDLGALATRAFTYLENIGKRVSIKQIRDKGCAFCSERAGMAHNIFKFLGVDSEVVIGYRDSERHAYNLVYPNGYGNEPMVIFDPSFSVKFIKKDHGLAAGYFKALRREDYEKLMSGAPIKIELSKTEKNYRQFYDLGEEYIFSGDTPSYIASLD